MTTKEPIKQPELRTWVALNEAVMGSTDEAFLRTLLKHELAGRKRVKFVERIQHRLNKVRGLRERRELQSKLV